MEAFLIIAKLWPTPNPTLHNHLSSLKYHHLKLVCLALVAVSNHIKLPVHHQREEVVFLLQFVDLFGVTELMEARLAHKLPHLRRGEWGAGLVFLLKLRLGE